MSCKNDDDEEISCFETREREKGLRGLRGWVTYFITHYQGSQSHHIFGQMPYFEDFARFFFLYVPYFGEEDLGTLLITHPTMMTWDKKV
jgi:hypothetical protein